jgi:hypothetical protein
MAAARVNTKNSRRDVNRTQGTAFATIAVRILLCKGGCVKILCYYRSEAYFYIIHYVIRLIPRMGLCYN